MNNPLLDPHDATENVQIGTIWKSLGVLAFGMLTFTTAGLFTWGVWVTMTLTEHGTSIAVLKATRSSSGVSQSVNVGEVKDADKPLEASAKTWLTTKDVAAREGITERTVINYIENGMIEPTPRKNGKAWEIAENFRIVPNDSENGGEIPQGP
jgi:transcriptional regulator with XRE-family HTH domain